MNLNLIILFLFLVNSSFARNTIKLKNLNIVGADNITWSPTKHGDETGFKFKWFDWVKKDKNHRLYL